MKKIILFSAILFVSSPCFADDPSSEKESTVTDEKDLGTYNDGTVTRDQPSETISHPCPYTCNDAGYSHGGCREWQDGDTCMIGPKLDRPQNDN